MDFIVTTTMIGLTGTIPSEAPRRELSRRERKEARRMAKMIQPRGGHTMAELDDMIRAGTFGLNHEVDEEIELDEMVKTHEAMRLWLERMQPGIAGNGDLDGYMTVPARQHHRFIAIGYAALDAFMRGGSLKVKA